MDDFPGNSRNRQTPVEKPVKEEKKIERVTSGGVVRRKTPLGTRLKELFVGGDAQSVWSYVTLDVLVPAAKDAIADAFSQGIERTLFGEARSTSRRGNRGGVNGFVSYNRMAPGSSAPPWRTEPRGREVSRQARATHDFDDIILETRGEAEKVLDRLIDLISQYGSATVADLYDLTGVDSNYTDNRWGWTDLRGSGIRRIRSGYLLELPRTESLE